MMLDRIAGVVFFLIGAEVAYEGFRIPRDAAYGPGPGFLPLWLGVGLMLLSAILCLTTRRPDRPFVENPTGLRKVALIAVSFLAYVFAMGYLGLLLATAILLAFLVGVVEGRGWRVSVAVGGLSSLGCYLLFEVWLRVPLPIGVFGI